MTRLKLSPCDATPLRNRQRYWLQLVRAPRAGPGEFIIFDKLYREIQTESDQPQPLLFTLTFNQVNDQVQHVKKYVPIELSAREIARIDDYRFAAWSPIITQDDLTVHVLRLTDDRFWQSLPTLVISYPPHLPAPNGGGWDLEVLRPPMGGAPSSSLSSSTWSAPPATAAVPATIRPPSPPPGTGPRAPTRRCLLEEFSNATTLPKTAPRLAPPCSKGLAMYHVKIPSARLVADAELCVILRRATAPFNYGNIYAKRRGNVQHEYYVFHEGPPIEGESLAVLFGKMQANFRRIPSVSTPATRQLYKQLNRDKSAGIWITISGQPNNFSLFRPIIEERLHERARISVGGHPRDRLNATV